MKKTFINRESSPPSGQGLSARRFRKAVESIMRRRSVDYATAVGVLKKDGMKFNTTVHGMYKRRRGCGNQPR